MGKAAMFYFNRTSALVGVALVLSACGTNFDSEVLRHQSDRSGSFSAELGTAYKKFALSEIDQMVDWIDGRHFGIKAQAAFANKIPEPEVVGNWWLTRDQKQIFTDARKRLVHSLNRHSKKQIPRVAAAAQTNFDCWIEQQEENWQIADINKCRNNFYTSVERLEEIAALARSQYLTQPKNPIVPARQTLIDPRSEHETRSYTLYFTFDKSDLGQNGKSQIDRVVRDYRAGAPVTILLAGHADRSGKKPHNLNLSRLRSEAVRRALIEHGVPVQMIEAHAFGETRPRKKTVDGMKEPLNRRVEITVGPAQAL
jgi:OmpA-OmpF porin, OOP family